MSPYVNNYAATIPLGRINEFLAELNEEERVEVLSVIEALSRIPHEPGLCEIVDRENRIFEAKGSTKDKWIRLFWFWEKIKGQPSNIVMTHGYLKDQNKTDPKEIKIAVKIMKKYFNSKNF